ncbi:msl8039 [Mesorhizobium japonicum MAFF 303099]|uniref:Msl8039 protein n=2 Tax=Mesorhizobium japonicum TaxID=2066070 RepID=Q984E4_RHILO|nr:msl8039 [Mesorhizobium japonicum MAFF 303099]
MSTMTDDKNKLGYQDRGRVSGDEEYEVGYFASKFGLSIPQVRELIAKHGNDRDTLEREAKALKGR